MGGKPIWKGMTKPPIASLGAKAVMMGTSVGRWQEWVLSAEIPNTQGDVVVCTEATMNVIVMSQGTITAVVGGTVHVIQL